ncbi:MAG: hypothetical protein ACYTFK_00705 [Planctomycetota bacterium]|jgi:hypothetical protein
MVAAGKIRGYAGISKIGCVTICLLAALCLIVLADGAWSQQERREDRAYNPKIKIGEFPPDFELPRLTFGKDANGKSVGKINDKDTVKLSGYRGKKPVCLIMSSYT